jgi:hypothetical protein
MQWTQSFYVNAVLMFISLSPWLLLFGVIAWVITSIKNS